MDPAIGVNRLVLPGVPKVQPEVAVESRHDHPLEWSIRRGLHYPKDQGQAVRCSTREHAAFSYLMQGKC